MPWSLSEDGLKLQKLLIWWDSPTQPPLDFKDNSLKREKIQWATVLLWTDRKAAVIQITIFNMQCMQKSISESTAEDHTRSIHSVYLLMAACTRLMCHKIQINSGFILNMTMISLYASHLHSQRSFNRAPLGCGRFSSWTCSWRICISENLWGMFLCCSTKN